MFKYKVAQCFVFSLSGHVHHLVCRFACRLLLNTDNKLGLLFKTLV